MMDATFSSEAFAQECSAFHALQRANNAALDKLLHDFCEQFIGQIVFIRQFFVVTTLPFGFIAM